MRLAIVTPYYHPIIGGVTTFVENLTDALRSQNIINIDLTIVSKQGNETNRIKILNSNKFYFVINTFFTLYKLNPDFIASQSHWYTLVPSVIYKLFNPKTRLIHTFHTSLEELYIHSIKRKVIEFLLSKVDLLMFVCQFSMEEIKNVINIKSSCRVVPICVKQKSVTQRELNEFKKKHLLKKMNPIISFVGPFVYKKKVEGIKILINSLVRIKKFYPNIRLLLVGDGNYREEIEKHVKEKGLEEYVIFTGFMNNSFIPLTITNVYAHISLQDAFPIALLEAMSLGKPVIATSVGGIPEIIVDGENGILVKETVESVENAILSILRNKNLAEKLGKNAKKTILEFYDLENFGLTLAKLFVDLR